MPNADFMELMIAHQMEPFGDLRGDYQAGTIAAMIANVNRKPNSKPFGPDDFLLFKGPPKPKQQTPEEMIRILQQYGSNVRVKPKPS